MSEDNKALEILITTKAELSGAKALEESLQRQIGAAKALGKGDDVKRLTADLTSVRAAMGKATEGNSDLAKELEHGGEAAEEAGISHRELRKTLLDIGNVAAPGAGHALMELAGGPVGVALALVAVFELVKERLKETEEESDKLAEALNEPMNGGAETVEKAWGAAATAMGDYFAKMKTAGQDNDPEATQLKRIKELTDAEVDSAKKRVQAMADVQEAQLRTSGASELAIQLLHAQTERAIATLDQQRDHQNGVALLEKEQLDRLAKTQELYERVATAKKEFGEAKVKYDQDNALLQNAQDILAGKGKEGEALKKQQDDATKEYDEASTNVRNAKEAGLPEEYQEVFADKLREAQEKMERAARERERYQKVVRELGPEGNQIARDYEYKTAHSALDQAVAASEVNKTRLVQLPAEIDQAQKVESVKQQGNEFAGALKGGSQAISGDYAVNSEDYQAMILQFKESQKAGLELVKAAHEAAAAHSDALQGIQSALRSLQQANQWLINQINQAKDLGYNH